MVSCKKNTGMSRRAFNCESVLMVGIYQLISHFEKLRQRLSRESTTQLYFHSRDKRWEGSLRI
ncbi:hypothetical protein HZS_2012 [Henneguya salminicola]|nr:hypothetical protein HZS_2012 [Henneguya salminicola]